MTVEGVSGGITGTRPVMTKDKVGNERPDT
jgi:hypothetical protein